MGFFSDAIAAGREAAKRPERERAARLSAALAATPPADLFAVALGAVYRNVFLVELKIAAVESRPPAHLFLVELPENDVVAVAQFLRRDFGIEQTDDVRVTLSTLLDQLRDADHPAESALWIARASWVGFAAAGLQLLDEAEARAQVAPFAAAAVDSFESWADFGRHFLAGEAASPASNALGRRSLRKSVEALTSSAQSPWRVLDWPSATPLG